MIRYIVMSAMVLGLASCTPAVSEEVSEKDKCLRSVEEYMEADEAEAFCSQPSDCRKWWDDLTEEEQEDIQAPVWKDDPDWWQKCDEQNHDRVRTRGRFDEMP